MIGYHGRYEYFGKVAARLDDALNWVPARMTAAAIAVVSLMHRRRATAWRIARRDHGLTESPNAGYPMSAIAGALGIALEKAGHYQLNQEARAAGPDDIRRAGRLIDAALGVAIVTGILIWSSLC
jgi:adenosylcobinamide-phosphate synthase